MKVIFLLKNVLVQSCTSNGSSNIRITSNSINITNNSSLVLGIVVVLAAIEIFGIITAC